MFLMRSTLVLTIAAFALGAGAAAAADLPARTYTKAPVIPDPVFNWTGFYVGGNAGWLWSASNNVSNVGTDTGAGGLGASLNTVGSIPQSLKQSYNGFIGGAQAGYNWQVDKWVIGLEADIDGVNARSTASFVFPGNAVSVPLST